MSDTGQPFPWIRRLLVLGSPNTLETPYTEAATEFLHEVMPLHDAAVEVVSAAHAGSRREEGEALRRLEDVLRRLNGWT